MQIYNCGTDPFKNYSYNTVSSEGISTLQRFKYYLDNSKTAFDITPSNCLEYKTSSHKYNEKGKKERTAYRNGIQISFPVNIRGKEKRTLAIYESDTPSFNNLNNCANNGQDVIEWMAIAISYPTDLLRFEVILDESMEGYQFLENLHYQKNPESLHPEAYSTSVGCVILDQSEQQVTSEMDALSDGRLAKPLFEIENPKKGCKKVLWTIPNPKIGYRYLLYFTLSKVKN